jgi:hypothetical protein
MSRKLKFIIFAFLIFFGVEALIYIYFFRGTPPEIVNISKSTSPSGVWVAEAQMVVYGDHWFINVPVYEVTIKDLTRKDDSSTFFSFPIISSNNITLKWTDADTLAIEAPLNHPNEGTSKIHLKVNINYSKNFLMNQ